MRTSIFKKKRNAQNAAKKTYHPAIEAAVDYWCDAIKRTGISQATSNISSTYYNHRMPTGSFWPVSYVINEASPKKIAIFRTALADAMTKSFDMANKNVLHTDLFTTTNEIFEQSYEASKILSDAVKTAKLPPTLLPPQITMTVTADNITISQTTQSAFKGITSQTIWKAPSPVR